MSEVETGKIGKYTLEAEVGRGAHGVVYKARAGVDDTPVALKVVRDRGEGDRLMVEPAILAKLDHPCIIRVSDFFKRDGDLVVALEFIEGGDLKSALDRGETFTPDQVREMLTQMAGALAEAHAHGVVHRDIKPGNILIGRHGGRARYVLTDFGIGRNVEGIRTRKHAGGTFLFMAPEQLRGRPVPQSDLWSLGVVAYLMLTGRPPFPGPSLGELSRQILYDTPAPPGRLTPVSIDAELESIVMRLLDKSLSERVGSAEELLRSLGHTGRPAEVATARPRQQEAVSRSLDERLDREIRRKRIVIGVLIALYFSVTSALVSSMLMIGGMVMFYAAQRRVGLTRRIWALLGGAIILLIAARVQPVLVPIADPRELMLPGGQLNLDGDSDPSEALSGFFTAVVFVLTFALPVWAASVFAGLRTRQRDRLLRDIALESGTDSDRYLHALQAALETRIADVGLHLKYAEALFARGRLRDAAVEARLLLEQDPYNFGGNLLLANAYLALGLTAECDRVCRDYLAVSGFCFEFEELRLLCASGGGQP